MKTDLKIAFLTSTDPRDRRTWSGCYFQMLKSLNEQFTEVVPLGPIKLSPFLYLLNKLNNAANKHIFHRQYDLSRSKILGKYYAAIFKKKLKTAKFDLIFAPTASVEIAFLETDIPIYYYSDTSVSQIKNYYNTFSNLRKFSDKETELIQYEALQKSAVIIHASKWATDHVIKNYNVNETKSFTVAMGANIDKAPDFTGLLLKTVNKKVCNLLFLGMEWERKGGAIAYDALLELDRLGLETNLTICGCVPPKNYSHPKMKVIPFLNKNDTAQYEQLLELLDKTHFLILPTRAECAGIIFAEASAYGIPSITTDTGGIGTMVENNVNGFRLPLEAGGVEYANVIKSIFTDDEKYKRLVYSSRKKFDDELNWTVWGKKIKEIIINNPKTVSHYR